MARLPLVWMERGPGSRVEHERTLEENRILEQRYLLLHQYSFASWPYNSDVVFGRDLGDERNYGLRHHWFWAFAFPAEPTLYIFAFHRHLGWAST